MVRESHFRNTDPSLKKREAAWAQEAHSWVRDKATKVIFAPGASESLTVGDIMSRLDKLPDMPTGYVRYLDSALYQKRYQLVRSEISALAQSGFLEVGSTVNAKGRENIACYRRATESPRFEILLEGPACEDPKIREAFESWIHDNGRALTGLDSILIARVGSVSGGTNETREVPPQATVRRAETPKKRSTRKRNAAA